MAYATAAQMIERFDSRDIGDLLSDDTTPVDSGDFAADAKMIAALNDASGDIDASLLAGGMYSATDLSGLSGNSAYTLIRICCVIAMAYLMERRPGHDPEKTEKMAKQARDYLDRLRKGENVFAIAANITAGTPSIGGPTTIEYQNLNLVRDRGHFYPRRRNPDNR